MKIMRIVYVFIGAWMLAAGAFAQGDEFSMDDLRNQALQGAVDKARTELAGVQPARNKTIGVLPILGDNANRDMENRLKTALTRTGFTVVEARNDPLWDEIMREIEWGERKNDILDERTLVQFGRLKGIQAVLYGGVDQSIRPERMVFVEIELHLSSLETREHLWGGRFAERRYAAREMRGVVDLDSLVRRALQAAVTDATRGVATAPALADPVTAAILPLSGDLDNYATHLTIDALTSAGNVRLRELDLSTLGEARALLRDQPATADAVLVGAVRDVTPRHLEHDEIYQRTYKAEAEVQLSLEDARTGEKIWSGTGNGIVREVEKDRPIPLIRRLLRDYSRVFIGIGVFIVVVIVWGAFKRATTRVR